LALESPFFEDKPLLDGPKLKHLLAFAYQGKDIVFRFIIEYNSFRDFGP
jgi:hypothetical protein